MKKRKIALVLALVVLSLVGIKPVGAQNTNRAWCEEYFDGWWRYDGTAQFKPSYTIPEDAGYSLEEGKHVKQSYVNFTRKKKGEDVSVIGGRAYSKAATSKVNATYKATATASDSLNIFTNQTKFWYGWIYF